MPFTDAYYRLAGLEHLDEEERRKHEEKVVKSVDFADVMANRNSEGIMAEIAGYVSALQTALDSALEDPDGREDAMSCSLEQFVDAMSESIPTWGDGKLTMKSETSGREQMSFTMQNKGDALTLATQAAREVQKREPGLSLSAARSKVWTENPALAEDFRRLPAGEPVRDRAPVSKAGAVIQKHRAAVAELRKVHPDKRESELKMMAWDAHPDLQREYEEALKS